MTEENKFTFRTMNLKFNDDNDTCAVTLIGTMSIMDTARLWDQAFKPNTSKSIDVFFDDNPFKSIVTNRPDQVLHGMAYKMTSEMAIEKFEDEEEQE